MEKMIFGLNFGDSERLEVLGEVGFPAVEVASAKALQPSTVGVGTVGTTGP